MMKKSEPRKTAPNKAPVSRILRNLASHEAFHFYIGIGKPINKTATSLMDFVEKLRTVDVRSVEFHFQRQDFEKWLKDTVGDDQLSRRIGGIERKISGEALRNEIVKIVKGRLDEIKGAQMLV
jgi:hypothetical protein